MKQKINTLVGSIILVLMMLISTATPAFAATTDAWIVKDSMSIPRGSFQTEVVDGKIYAIGGFDGKNVLSSVEQFDPVANTWTPKATMFQPRFRFQTKVVNGKIYAIGGQINGGITSAVEEYDPTSDKWIPRASMSTPRYFFQTEVISGKIYAIGGGVNSSVEMYDPVSDTWTPKASMSISRNVFQTEVIDGKIYAIGGSDKNGAVSSVEEYDPRSNTWTPKASMSIPRAAFQTVVVGGKIYAIGGYSTSSSTNTVEVYNPLSNTWIPKASMFDKRAYFQTEVVDEKIFAIGIGTSTEEYSPVDDKWSKIASRSAQGTELQTQLINRSIYAIGGCYTSSIEEYIPTRSEPTLTVAASSNKVKVGQQFTTSVAIHNVTNICAEDIKITYDKELFTYNGAEAQTGLKIYKEDTSVPGTVRFISACEGKDNAATGDKGLITLKFTAKKEGTGKVDIIKGRIADNATLEEDVAEANCGEDTIIVEGYADVNRNGEFTLLDLGIDGWYNGMNAADTDTSKFSADVVADGKIDDNDLAEITKGILANPNYQPNNA